MNEITLSGCSASSLSSYLKALGIIRLVRGQLDNAARGYWKENFFVLKTRHSRDDLAAYFLNKYLPSPIISPWNGRAGFLEGDDGDESKRKGAVTLSRVERSCGSRFGLYRNVITAVRNVSVITRLDKTRAELKTLEKKKKTIGLDPSQEEQSRDLKRQAEDLKDSLLLSLRGELPDEFLPWIDACFILGMSNGTPAPLLGSGGNEGSMDFSINHISYLFDLINENSDEPTLLAENLIDNALYGNAQFLESSPNIGFLDTFTTGGVNMSNGFDGKSTGNTWNSVLAIEGAILFSGSTTKRLESTRSGRPNFPFAVSPVYAGEGSIASKESARPEIWLPIWDAPASVVEISRLFAEGRTTLGRHQAESGLDMLRALSSLGVDRGVTAFERYGIYERRGKGYFVTTHIGHYAVRSVQAENWILSDLAKDGWLRKFRNYSQDKKTANRFIALCKRLEDRLFDLSERAPSGAEVQALLALLGEIQSALASSSKAREAVDPLPRLSVRWIQAADDLTPAFRIARALVGLRDGNKYSLPLCAQLFPVHPRYPHKWIEVANEFGNDPSSRIRIYTGTAGSLSNTLRNLLDRRLLLAEKLEMEDKPLGSSAGATLDDVAAFLQGHSMDRRITALLPGLSLCSIPEEDDRSSGDGALPAAFALLKLCFAPDSILRSLHVLEQSRSLPVPVGILAQLASGHKPERVTLTAWRRLHASGVNLVFSPDALPSFDGISPQRMAAALLIPLRYGAYARLAQNLLKKVSDSARNPAA